MKNPDRGNSALSPEPPLLTETFTVSSRDCRPIDQKPGQPCLACQCEGHGQVSQVSPFALHPTPPPIYFLSFFLLLVSLIYFLFSWINNQNNNNKKAEENDRRQSHEKFCNLTAPQCHPVSLKSKLLVT